MGYFFARDQVGWLLILRGLWNEDVAVGYLGLVEIDGVVDGVGELSSMEMFWLVDCCGVVDFVEWVMVEGGLESFVGRMLGSSPGHGAGRYFSCH